MHHCLQHVWHMMWSDVHLTMTYQLPSHCVYFSNLLSSLPLILYLSNRHQMPFLFMRNLFFYRNINAWKSVTIICWSWATHSLLCIIMFCHEPQKWNLKTFFFWRCIKPINVIFLFVCFPFNNLKNQIKFGSKTQVWFTTEHYCHVWQVPIKRWNKIKDECYSQFLVQVIFLKHRIK